MKGNNIIKPGWILACLVMLWCCSSELDHTPDSPFKPDDATAQWERISSIWELIGKGEADTTNMGAGETRITLQYLQEKALVLPAIQLYNIRTDTIVFTPYFEINKLYFDKDTSFVQEAELELPSIPEEADIKSEDLSASLTYWFIYTGFEYQVQMTLKNVYQKGTTKPIVISETVNDVNTKGTRKTVSLDFTIDLTGGKKVDIETKVTIKEGATLFEPQTIALLVKSLNMRLQKASGYFQVPPMPLDSSNLKMNLDILSNLSNAFDLSDPRYYLLVRNKGFGFPVEVQDIRLHANSVDPSKKATLTTTDSMYFEANVEDRVRVDTFEYTPENSNLIDFLRLPPHGNINYTGVIQFNPNGRPKVENVVYADGVAEVDSYMEIPLVLKSASMLCRDTLVVNLEEVLKEKKFGRAKLSISTTTDIPFEMSMLSVGFYNEKYELLDTISFEERLLNNKSIDKDIPEELLPRLPEVKYCIVIIRIMPSQDILSIRQDASLKLRYTILGETK